MAACQCRWCQRYDALDARETHLRAESIAAQHRGDHAAAEAADRLRVATLRAGLACLKHCETKRKVPT